MQAQRGTRDKIEKYFDLNQPLKVQLQIQGAAVYDFSCFGLDKADKLSDDRYMIFYNQPESPSGEIFYKETIGGAEFTIDFGKMPAQIQKLVFTGSIDGVGTMGEISAHKIILAQSGREIVTAEFTGADFQQEKAVTALEIYFKDGWRFNVVARGFNGGLDVLLKSFGGEVAEEKPQKVSLEKKIAEGAPKLVSLVKPLKVELEKRNLLDVTAKVALVMDISGSMYGTYQNGTVREIVNKMLPIAVQFDDDGELDFWYYGSYIKRMPTVNMRNYESAVPANWQKLMSELGGGTDALRVMKDVVREFENSEIPAYVIFVTDGEISNNVERIIAESSRLPIFWQFVGIGRSGGYGFLERLDNLSGRVVDNTNFFALDDFRNVANSDLYSRLLNEFPNWLKEARCRNII